MRKKVEGKAGQFSFDQAPAAKSAAATQTTAPTELKPAPTKPPKPAKPKGPAPAPTAPAVDARAIFADAERTLLSIVRRGEDEPTPEQWPLFDLVGWDRFKVGREILRAKALLEWKAQAGSESDRAESQRVRDEEQRKLDEAEPSIQQQIDQLQAELSALRRNRDQAAQALKRRETAFENTLRSLPEYLKQEAGRRAAAFNRELRGPKYQAQVSRLNTFRAVVYLLDHPNQIDPGDHDPAQNIAVRQAVERAGFDLRQLIPHQHELRDEFAQLEQYVASIDQAEKNATRQYLVDAAESFIKE